MRTLPVQPQKIEYISCLRGSPKNVLFQSPVLVGIVAGGIK